ncbi:MAG: dTDP-4-dehydrorhamnose 3,5-epimerase [Pseudomonadota bacterium]
MITELEIPDVKVISPRIFRDDRGFFSETYNKFSLAEFGFEVDFVQDNHSLSRKVGVIRGLHFQIDPHPQGKLIRVTRGAVFDVAVDIRHGSPTYGKHVSRVLSAENWEQLWVPVGFAHGFCTIEPDTEVVYKVSGQYSSECDRGLLWNDPSLGIAWPVAPDAATLSDKDKLHPPLAELPIYFSDQ